jgi:hypothetical protein
VLTSKDHFITQNEAFCPVLGEVPLDTPATGDDFLPAAVEYANKSCWGSLTVTVIIDRTTSKGSKAALAKAVDDLKFGAVSINHGAMNSVLMASLPWVNVLASLVLIVTGGVSAPSRRGHSVWLRQNRKQLYV